MGRDVPFVRRLSLFGALGTNKNEVSGAQRGRERHAAPAADAHGGRLAARAQPPRPLSLPRNTDAMELADVPRHRPLAFDKMESLIKEMQDPETGVPVRSQKLFLSVIPSAFMGYDLVEWIMDRFNLDETSNVEAINLANQLCQYGYFFPVNDLKNLVLKDDSSLYRFQSPYYWPWQGQRVAGSGSSAPSLGPDNIEYAIYLVKRTLRNKQRHALDDYEQEALANLKKNLAAKWDFITMQAEEQVRLAKDRKKGDKIVSDSQERAYWRVARPPPGAPSALEPCPVPVRARNPRPKKRNIEQLQREIEHLKLSLDRTRVKTSIALEALIAYSETFTPYDPWLTPPQPSNPWISDDTLFWQINSPLVDVPSEKRVQRWALSIEELVSDPTGLQEFTSFLRKEYSHENIRFWLAVMDLRRSSTKQIPKKLEEIYELQEFTCFPCMAYSSKNTRFCLAIMSLLCSSTKQISKNIEEIYEEFLKPGAPCEINIDGATAEKAAEGLRSGSRYALDHAADHVYGLLLKKDCYPRFVRSDHFQRLLTEGRNVHQKKAKFFNFGGQVKKKPCVGSGPGSAGGAGAGPLSRRRGSDRSLSGSAHELAVCATHAPPAHSRAPEPPPHSHSQSNLCDLRDPLEDSMDDVLPWESTSREGVYGARRRQDSAADSGSSSSDVSAAVAVGVERARRLPQQSTLDGGLRGAPPPLRRLSAVEPRHLAPLGSPPHSPRQTRAPPPTPAPVVPHAAPPHPTPTISVSSAPDDESTGSPPGPGSPDDRRSLAHSDEPSSVFASADATPTEPTKSLIDRCALATEKTVSSLSCDNCRTDVSNVEVKVPSADEFASQVCALSQESCDDSPAAGAKVDSKVSDRTRSFEEDVASVRRTLSREPSTTKEISPASNKDSSKIGDLPGNVSEKESVTEAAGSSSTPEVSEMAGPSLSAPPAPAPKEAAPAASTSASLQLAEVAPMPMEESRVEQTCAAPTPGPAAGVRAPVAPVAPLAVGEDIGADDDNVDKVPSAPLQRVSGDSKAASESDATKRIAHKDELSSVSESNIVKRDNKSDSGERKQRNDICPWEDENSCESDAPFVKTYATLGYL